MSRSIPKIINFDKGKIYGILRKPNNSKKLFIILPAVSGTRLGPQRIFVEIANALYDKGIASLCVDLPPLGDSFSYKKFELKVEYFKLLTIKYEYYLQIILNDIKADLNFEEIGLMSISYGCIPCFNFSLKSNIKSLVLLSPDHITISTEKINQKNLKMYYYKFFQKNTWKKAVRFQVNYKKIWRNIFNKRSKLKEVISDTDFIKNKELKILSLFGEKDPKLNTFIKYWHDTIKKNQIKNYEFEVIKNSDHSFFGWELKREVEKHIVNWLKR